MTRLMFDDLDAKQLRAVADFYETQDFLVLAESDVSPVIEVGEEDEPDYLIGFENREERDAVVF